ncbi:MAG TPA: methyltransferase domain-containing protein [Caldilineaceae bacterium]|nr:methyltransferase domain-containing protein [Caldilineaceae bacterium]
MSDHVFTGSEEMERLRLQAQVWQPEAEAMLEHIGVAPGWRCVDLGCGAMGILGPLSRRAGPTGRVVGVDQDATLLAAAQTYIRQEGLANVELLRRDVYQTGLTPASFDLVHERFVFPYVASPELLLQEMVSLVKPGGIVAVQEIDHSSWNFWPASERWRRLVRIIEQVFALWSDINIGRRAYTMLRNVGLTDVRVHAAVQAHQASHPYLQAPLLMVQAMRARIVNTGIATPAELDELLDEARRLAADPEVFQISFTLVQVWGRKPNNPPPLE